MVDEPQQVSVNPGYAIPGWRRDQLAIGKFMEDGLKCPIPGCLEVFRSDTHGKRYTAEKWKAHVTARELHYYLWYDPDYCYQPPALRFTFIRVDKRHKIAVCHFRREPVQFSKLQEHCTRCKGCLGIDRLYESDENYQAIRNITKQQLQRDGVAIQGFEACEAFHCCTKLYGSSVQGIHAHLKTAGDHNPSGPMKCMRYRTTKHGYAYVPISDLEYEKLNSVHDGMVIVEAPSGREWERVQRRSRGGGEGNSGENGVGRSISTGQVQSATTTSQRRPSVSHIRHRSSDYPYGVNKSPSHRKISPPTSEKPEYHTVESFRQAVLSDGYELFERFFTSMLQSCTAQLEELTWNRQSSIISSMHHRINDDLANTSAGYSCLRDPSTNDQLYALVTAAQSPSVHLFKNGLNSKEVKDYTDKCDHFLESLMVLVYCSIANTPSPGELLGWTYANTSSSIRSMFIENDRVVFRGRQHNDDKYLPWSVGELLLRYLRVVRPFEIYLAQHLHQSTSQVRAMYSLVFMGYKAKVSETDLSSSMRRVTSKVLHREVSECVWKSLLHTIMNRVSDKEWTSRLFNEAWFNSTGLSRIGPRQVPSLGAHPILQP